MRNALLLIDIQNDFCTGGALAVLDGEAVVPVANRLMRKFYDKEQVVIATQDWHPAGHGSFASAHGVPIYTMGTLSGVPQRMWPDHCVQDTKGAEFHPDLLDPTYVINKGMDPTVDSYSGFFDNGGNNPTGMDVVLKEHQVTDLFIVGLATDFCVMFTALDAIKLGYRVTVIPDGCRGVNLPDGSVEKAYDTMMEKGILIRNIDAVEEILNNIK